MRYCPGQAFAEAWLNGNKSDTERKVIEYGPEAVEDVAYWVELHAGDWRRFLLGVIAKLMK